MLGFCCAQELFGFVLKCIGALSAFFFLLSLARFLYVHLLRPKASLKKYGAGNGYWAGEACVERV